MPSRIMNRLGRDQRGITGLETAIILIAFVVVASVFAYTVLSAGVFSAEKGKQAVHAGLETARSSMEIVGNVHATSIARTVLHSADVSWTTATSDITDTTETADRKEGTASRKLDVAGAFGSGLIAFKDITAVNLNSPDHFAVRLWVKSDTTLVAGVLELLLDDSTGCASPEQTMGLPALTANVWKHALLDIPTPATSTLDAVVCVGISAASDPGTIVLYIDDVEAPAEVSDITFVVANALSGEAINLTTTADVDSDGFISDEATINHVVSVVYADDEQRITDITWTRTELGKGDGDSLLEPGEKMLITIKTHGADPVPVENTRFTISLVRDKGSDLIIERTLPGSLSTEMDLN
ncbi:MAG: archaellin/type IV pilin N-terminal domain-containing protein [Dehalococcoidia bacterium]